MTEENKDELEIENQLREFESQVSQIVEDTKILFESFLRDEKAREAFLELIGEIPNNQGRLNGNETDA